MTNRGTPLEQAVESLRKTEEALARNLGKLTEPDWRDALERQTERVIALGGKP